MKQYKCIHPYYQKYGSYSAENGYYAEIRTIPKDLIITKANTAYIAKGFIFKAEEIENNNVNWQEIPQKEYEILSFKVISTGKIIKEHFPGYTELDYTGSNRHWNIHSVKRLSDGEVFTIGDEVEYKSSNRWYNEHKGNITKLYVCNNELMIDTSYTANWAYLSHSIRKTIKPKPLFTTEDGVDIFDGDNCYYVRTNLIKVEEFLCESDFWLGNLKLYKWFSTKEKAQEYIDLNQPKLSINDIKEVIHLSDSDIKKLIDIINSKK